jgi:hypothetical protein
LGIRSGEPDILQHSVVERSELGALVATPAPFTQARDDVIPSIAQCENSVMLPRPAPGGMPMNRYHMNSPKLGERRNHASVELPPPKMAATACLDKREFLSDGLDFLIRYEQPPAAFERAAGV